jgi:Trk-type K+ transport system membrane component
MYMGIASPDVHGIGKLVLIVFMWMGRVEIIAALALFYSLLRPLRQESKE